MENKTMMKPPDFTKKQEIPSSTLSLMEQQNDNLLTMVKNLEAEKELLLFSMSELDNTLDLATRTLELSEKLNAAYEYILKQQGCTFDETEVFP